MSGVSITYVTVFDVEFFHFPLAMLDNKPFQKVLWLGISRIVDNWMTDNERQVNVGVAISKDKMPGHTPPLTIYMTCAKNGSHDQSIFNEKEEALMFEIADHLEDTIMRYATHKHTVVPFARLPKIA